MKKDHHKYGSMRLWLTLTVTAMGAIALLATLAAGEVYTRQVLATHRANVEDLISAQTKELLKDLSAEASALAFSIQGEASFRAAIRSAQPTSIEKLLGQQFQRNIAVEGIIQLEELVVYDRDLNYVAHHSRSPQARTHIHCPELVARARTASEVERLKTATTICVSHGVLHHSVLVPTGGLFPTGYLQLTSAPVLALLPLEKTLGKPLRITDSQGVIQYTSRQWPPHLAEDRFITEYKLLDSAGRLGLRIAIMTDSSTLEGNLLHTRLLVMTSALGITTLAVLIALWALRRTVMAPLQALSTQLDKIRADKSLLGKRIAVSGTQEVYTLAEAFNALSVELRNVYETLEQMALTDSLTKLPNRLHLHARLSGLISLGQTQHIPFALFIMDVDRFKQINDTLGHTAGDALLTQISQRFAHVSRHMDVIGRTVISDDAALNQDTFGRLGGDEFAGLFPLVGDPDQAARIAQRIMDIMAEPFIVDDQVLAVSLSIGIALFPTHGTDPSVLMRGADVAMYFAKRNHIGYAVYAAEQATVSIKHLTLEHDLKSATEQNQLMVYYQPQAALRDGTVCGAEALLRWKHPTRGFIPPDEFIPLAEETGLIKPITLWVLRQVAQDWRLWKDRGIDIGVSVNISATSLLDSSIVDTVETILNEYHIPVGVLTLEITERALMSNTELTLTLLSRLDHMGVRLSIDDFGTGYSALTMLKQLPLDEIKIDKSFVIDMLQDANDGAIVQAVIDIGKRLRLSVVAEGVEELAHWQALQSHGADIAQGYFIAKPQPSALFLAWLEEKHSSLALAATA